jgi:sugar/nucleoside kinase (ribokinase family)
MDGVDTSAIVLDSGLKTGATVVLSTGAERAFVTYMGSISEVRRSDISPEMLAMASHLHIGSYFLQRRLHPDMVELLQEAKGLGLTTSVDPGWDNFREWNGGIIEALPFVDVFLPNLVEAMQITKADSGEGALKVLAKHGNLVVIKMGSEGCLVCQRDTRFHLPAFKVPVVDVTSAGDVFNAGFLYGFLMDWELEHTARFANGCGAIAVSQVGSAGMISGVSQVQEFLAGRARDSRVQ